MNEYLKNNPNMIVPHLLEFLRKYREKECADVPVIVEAIERLRHLENQVLQSEERIKLLERVGTKALYEATERYRYGTILE